VSRDHWTPSTRHEQPQRQDLFEACREAGTFPWSPRKNSSPGPMSAGPTYPVETEDRIIGSASGVTGRIDVVRS
jgi:hypothetical protein